MERYVRGESLLKKGENTNQKNFEKSARTLLKHGIGGNIEEVREKLRGLIEAQKGVKKRKRRE